MKQRWLLDRAKDGKYPFEWKPGADVKATFERIRREQAEATKAVPSKVEPIRKGRR